jgi:hypothetical protein
MTLFLALDEDRARKADRRPVALMHRTALSGMANWAASLGSSRSVEYPIYPVSRV